MPEILVVCTANVCRSPIAQALLSERLRRADPHGGWRVSSAGTWARPGQSASESGQIVMARRGLDLSRHRSRIVSRELLQGADLVLVMTANHREAMQAEFPELASRVYLLSEMVGARFDLPDPYGGPLSEYEQTAVELESVIEAGLGRIRQLAGRGRQGDGETIKQA
ncbi:MAG: low molecular weight protein arginine phosphatase, partial [Chloroflexi bacterium]|nr:low molecular weight protein arginine phosphatase [Chloroflexota bacterium]